MAVLAILSLGRLEILRTAEPATVAETGSVFVLSE